MKQHLLSEENGDAPIAKLNDWEGEVVRNEIARDGALAWYRNPPRQTAESLGIVYRDEMTGNWRSMRPDFAFPRRRGEARASIDRAARPALGRLARQAPGARCVR